jgi:hypothetical protein
VVDVEQRDRRVHALVREVRTGDDQRDVRHLGVEAVPVLPDAVFTEQLAVVTEGDDVVEPRRQRLERVAVDVAQIPHAVLVRGPRSLRVRARVLTVDSLRQRLVGVVEPVAKRRFERRAEVVRVARPIRRRGAVRLVCLHEIREQERRLRERQRPRQVAEPTGAVVGVAKRGPRDRLREAEAERPSGVVVAAQRRGRPRQVRQSRMFVLL